MSLIPIDFSLLNPVNNEGVLFTLGQDEGQKLNLNIINLSLGDLKIRGGSEAVSDRNYNFALCFTPGMLSNAEQLQITPKSEGAAGQNWSFFYKRDDQGFDCYYLRWSGDVLTLPLGGTWHFELSGIKITTMLSWRHSTVVLRSRDFYLGDAVLPESTRRIPITVMHTYPASLAHLEETGSLKPIVIQLRDKILPPLKARIVNGWNMLANNNERTISIEIFPNPDFFGDEAQEIFAPKDMAAILIMPVRESVSVDISAVIPDITSPWEILPNTSGIEHVTIKPKAGEGCHFTKDQTLLLELTLTTGDFAMVNLEIQFQGFKHEDIDLEDFNCHLPLYIGPFEIDRNGNAGIGAAPGAERLLVAGDARIEGRLTAGIYNIEHLQIGDYSIKKESSRLEFLLKNGNPFLTVGSNGDVRMQGPLTVAGSIAGILDGNNSKVDGPLKIQGRGAMCRIITESIEPAVWKKVDGKNEYYVPTQYFLKGRGDQPFFFSALIVKGTVQEIEPNIITAIPKGEKYFYIYWRNRKTAPNIDVKWLAIYDASI